MLIIRFLILITIGAIGVRDLNAGVNADTLNKNRLAVVIAGESIFYAGGVSFLGFIWYKDRGRVPFHTYNDLPGWLQIDKAAHAYVAYHESYLGYNLLRWSGVSKRKSIWYGGLLGFFLQAPIEIFDGLYKGYGFSTSDIVANALGSSLFTVQQSLWDDQLIKMKFSYAPSPYAMHNPYYLGDNHIKRLFSDYNGHTYWLSCNLQGITGLKNIPPWINLALGYGGNGMLLEFENPTDSSFPYFQRYRQYFLSLDIDFSKINTKSKFFKSYF